MPLTRRQSEVAEASSPAFETGRKLDAKEKTLLWQWLQADPACPSRDLQAKLAQEQPEVWVSLRHLNRRRALW